MPVCAVGAKPGKTPRAGLVPPTPEGMEGCPEMRRCAESVSQCAKKRQRQGIEVRGRVESSSEAGVGMQRMREKSERRIPVLYKRFQVCRKRQAYRQKGCGSEAEGRQAVCGSESVRQVGRWQVQAGRQCEVTGRWQCERMAGERVKGERHEW